MTTLAITGATGFVGQAVLAEARHAGHHARALTRQARVDRIGWKWVTGTLEAPAALAGLCAGADAVIHVAGAVNVPTRADFAAANIAGTQAIVEAAQAAGVRRFVHVSSLAAREPALSNYGWSKAGAEDVVRASALDWTIVRPPGVYGPGDRDMLDLFKMARRGVMLLPPTGRGSWIHVDDLARLLVALASDAATSIGQTYEPDDGAAGGVSHRALGAAIGKAVGRQRALTIAAPRWLLMFAARADRLARGASAKLTPDRARYMAHPDWMSDPARRPPAHLWSPTWSLEAGLADTAAHYIGAGLLKP